MYHQKSLRNRTGIYRILLFLIISVGVSNVFRFDLLNIDDSLEELPAILFLLSTFVLEGSGVILGALAMLYMLRKERKISISLFGTSAVRSLGMPLIPLILLSVFGVENRFGLDPRLFGFYAGMGTLIYCILEEYGWRGYLQEELRDLEPWKKYVIIGSLWYLWHLSFLTSSSIPYNLFFLVMLIVGSWGLGQLAESTRSITASACFHMIIQIMLFNTLIRDGISGTEKLFIAGVSIPIWMGIMRGWNKRKISPRILDNR